MQIEKIPTIPLSPYPRARTIPLRLPLSDIYRQWLAVTVLSILVALLIGIALGIVVCYVVTVK